MGAQPQRMVRVCDDLPLFVADAGRATHMSETCSILTLEVQVQGAHTHIYIYISGENEWIDRDTLPDRTHIRRHARTRTLARPSPAALRNGRFHRGV